jgi:LacI family transcriptional regulator
MRGKPTMNEVAREAKVSLGTVSKVLNGKVTVAEELRKRVLAACSKLNYQRNQIAASLRSRETHTIGIIVPDILNTLYAALVEKIENLASSAGYTVIIVATGENSERAQARIGLLRERQVDGMIVMSSLESSDLLATAVGAGMPCIVVDRINEDNPFPSVATDNVDATYQGTKHLLSLGHRKIVFAVTSPHLWNTQERISGFEQAMREAQAKADVRVVGLTVQEAQISLSNLFRSPDRPTALFTGNNIVTLGAVCAQLECGLSIPDDMSLLSFDDFEWLKLLRPAVSAVQQPVDQIAVEAWRLLSHQIGKRTIAVPHIRIGAQLMIRQSTVACVTRGRKVKA